MFHGEVRIEWFDIDTAGTMDDKKMCGVSTLEYFKQFFNAAIKREQFQMHLRNAEREQLRILSKAVMQGRTDYERSAFLRSSSSKRF